MKLHCLPFVTAFLILCLLLPSCNSSKKLIVREWKISDMDMATDFSESPKHLEIFNNFRDKGRLVFNQDGTYFFDLTVDTQSGTWTISEKGKLLTTISSQNLTTVNKILELSEQKLVLFNEKEDNLKLTLTPKK